MGVFFEKAEKDDEYVPNAEPEPSGFDPDPEPEATPAEANGEEVRLAVNGEAVFENDPNVA